MTATGDQEDDFNVGFFDRNSTQQAIERLASATTLTVFAGAGVSADQSLHTWSSLVRELAKKSLAPIVGRAAAEYGDFLVNTYHQMPAASIVDELYAEAWGDKAEARRNSDLRKALYPKLDAQDAALAEACRPLGRIATYVARLAAGYASVGHDVHVITTNYDDTIEAAFRDPAVAAVMQGGGIEVKAITRLPQHLPAKCVPIVHVHGYIPRQGASRDVVFAEQDYANWSRNSELRMYLIGRLANGHTLFVGTSLRDYNIVELIRHTYSLVHPQSVGAAKELTLKRVALLPVQGEVDELRKGRMPVGPISVSLPVLRGRHIGVDMLRPDFYGQLSQFMHELELHAIAVQAGEHVVPYDKRLRAWADAWGQINGATPRQDRVEQAFALSKCATAVNDLVPEAEQVKVELWARRDVEAREVELWLSSQSVWTDGPTYWPHSAKIKHDSKYVAVSTFAKRSVNIGTVEYRVDGRWTHFMALPVLLKGEPYLEIPVGVVAVLLHCPQYRGADKVPSLSTSLQAIIDTVRPIQALLVPEHCREWKVYLAQFVTSDRRQESS